MLCIGYAKSAPDQGSLSEHSKWKFSAGKPLTRIASKAAT